MVMATYVMKKQSINKMQLADDDDSGASAINRAATMGMRVFVLLAAVATVTIDSGYGNTAVRDKQNFLIKSVS